MRRIFAFLGPCISGAVLGGVLWWQIDRLYVVNNVGLLTRQGWPLGNMWMFVAAAGSVGLVVGWLLEKKRLAHERACGEVSHRMGFAFSSSPEAVATSDPELTNFSMFKDGGRAWNRMTGRQDGLPVDLFDCLAESDDSDGPRRVTVIVVGGSRLPDFELRPRSQGGRILAWAGIDGMTFDPAGASNQLDFDAVDAFNRLFMVGVPDMGTFLAQAATGKEENSALEHEVRAIFTPRVMRRLAQHPGWSAQAHGERLVLWRGGGAGAQLQLSGEGGVLSVPIPRSSGFCPAQDRPKLIDEALAIRRALVGGGAGSGEPTPSHAGEPAGVIPALANRSPARRFDRMNCTVAFGVAGAGGGFFLGGAAWSSLFFSGPRAIMRPGLGLSMSLIPFASAAAGAVLGAALGRRVEPWLARPRLGLPDETPAEIRWRVRARNVGAVCGAMTGFMAGGFGGGVMSGTLEHSGPSKWLVPLVFFGGASLGLFTGFLVGMISGNEIGRRTRKSRSFTSVSTTNPEAANRLSGALFLLMGLLALAVALGVTVHQKPWKWSRMFGARQTTGEVIKLERIESNGGEGPRTAIHPRVRYRVADESYEIGGMGNVGYKVGDTVPVTYPPDHPEQGAIDRFFEQFAPIIMFGGVGSIFSLIGFAVLRRGGRGKSPGAT